MARAWGKRMLISLHHRRKADGCRRNKAITRQNLLDRPPSSGPMMLIGAWSDNCLSSSLVSSLVQPPVKSITAVPLGIRSSGGTSNLSCCQCLVGHAIPPVNSELILSLLPVWYLATYTLPETWLRNFPPVLFPWSRAFGKRKPASCCSSCYPIS